MAKDFSKAFYRSKAWKECRPSYIKSVRGLCEDCLAKGLYVPGKVVHHINHISPDNIDDPNVLLAWDNLRFVCQDCHAKEHAKSKRYLFDSDGNIIVLEE